MWASIMENGTSASMGNVGMRESNPAWRGRDLPPTPAMTYQQSKVTAWLDRGGNIDETRMDKERGHTFLISAVIANNEDLVAELLRRGASVDIKAQGKNALHFACVLGHSSCVRLLLLHGSSPEVRVDQDNSDYTECDGMDALEIVREKIVFARDPLRERLAEIGRMLEENMMQQG